MRRTSFRPALAFSLALRGLVRDRGASLVAMSILALGIAAPATFFSFLVGATRPLTVPEVLPLLRVTPVLGRVPAADEAATTFLLGHALWQELYAGDPSALGRIVDVNGTRRTIVGVLPEGFGFPFKQDGWFLTEPGFAGSVELVGRLAPGATPGGVAAELGPRWLRGDALRSPEGAGGVVRVESFTGSRGEGGETVAFAGLVLVGLCLLLIACANVASLLLVRATERVRALAVQATAIVRGRENAYVTRIPRVLAGMAVAGGMAGLLVAAVGLYGLLAFRVRQRRRELAIRLSLGADGRRLAWQVIQVALRQLAPAGVLRGD